MKRREFMLAVAAAAAPFSLLPLPARAQQAPKVAVVGALVIGNTDPGTVLAGVQAGHARSRIYRRAKHSIQFRSAQGKLNRLPELAAELVRLKVDVIVTWFTPTAQAAKQ